MKPSYQQARPDAAANITLATKAKQVEAWLETLPHDDALASAALLANYLAAHDRAEVAAAFRKQLRDLVSVSIARIMNALALEFRDMPLPMDARQLDHVGHALRLLAAAAEFNKRLILESADRSPPLFGENPLPGHLGHFLQLQREILELCHLSHRQLPEGYWLDTHQAGLKLIEAGLYAAPDPARPGATLGELYLAVLLEATADPYHFSAQERIWTQDIIARHGRLAVIEPAQATSQGGVFGIRAGEDKPPFPLSWQNAVAPDCDLVLNTAPLVRKLALVISQMGRERRPQEAIANVHSPAYQPLLQRLKAIWGGSSQRATARHRHGRLSQRTAVIGFYPVYHHLSGTAGQADEKATVQCHLVNESLGGLALLVARPAFRLKVGSLVCVSRGQGDAWSDLGLVRWFKSGPNGDLSFGIKYLRGKMRPCLWAPSGDGQSYPGLLAEPDDGAPQRPRNLVMPALRVDPQARLEVRQGERRLLVQLDGRQESLPDIDIFRCTPVGH